MQDRAGDPVFNIQSPSNDDVELPNFSVWGSCSDITSPTNPTIIVTSGPDSPTAEAQLNVAEKTWEAVLNGVSAGSHEITATCSSGVFKKVTISVGSSPPYTVDAPAAPGPFVPGENPWAGWTVGGTYVKGQVTKIDLYITRHGAKLPVGSPATRTATLRDDGTWTLALDSFPIADYRGRGFCIHTVATTTSGTVRGSVPRVFAGPPN
jgi:hypothetical protein